eukprot:gene31940-41434_t
MVPGLEAGQQSVLFKGKVLSSTDRLEDVGVAQGDVLNVLKGRKTVRSPNAVANNLFDDSITSSSTAADSLSNKFSPNMSQEEYNEAIKNANPEDVKNAMKAMDNMLDSNVFDEYLADDEKLETARQQMLANMDQYANMMPGFKEQVQEIATDPEKWKQAMFNAKKQIEKLREQRDSIRAKTRGEAVESPDAVTPAAPSIETESASPASVDDISDEESSTSSE